MKNKILTLLIFTLTVNSLQAQKEFNLFGNLKFGSYDIGVKQLTFTDTIRSEPRKISISIWYPAEENDEKIKFSNYLDFNNELNESELLAEISVGIGGAENLFSIDSLTEILNVTMKASREAKAIADTFPLLLWSARYGTVAYQNMLSEYIASHGYIVAFAEDIPSSPYPWQLQTAEEKEKALHEHIADMNAAISYLKQQQNVDETKIGLLAWSYAGESAILAQMNNPDIDLVVGLSALGFSGGVYLGATLSEKIDVQKLHVPYLILSQKLGANGNTMTPPDIFDSMHSDSRYVSFRDLAHGNFNVMEGMLPGILRTNKVQSWSNGGEVAQIGFEAICEITRSFLNAVFQEADLTSFEERNSLLKENLPEGFITITAPKKTVE